MVLSMAELHPGWSPQNLCDWLWFESEEKGFTPTLLRINEYVTHRTLETEPTACYFHLQCVSARYTLSCAGAFTVIQLDELSITDKTQPIFNSFIHQAEDIPDLQQFCCPIGVESREQLHLPTKIAGRAGMQVP